MACVGVGSESLGISAFKDGIKARTCVGYCFAMTACTARNHGKVLDETDILSCK